MTNTVTKKDIVKEVAQLTGYDTQSIKDVVQTMFDCMCEGLAEDGNIEIRNFGIFRVKSTPERQARNPKTSEIITVPAKRHIHFKPGQEMKMLINREEMARVQREEQQREEAEKASVLSQEAASAQDDRGEGGEGSPNDSSPMLPGF